ncbi:MAG: alpha/beta hydrolase [Reichenbachiella sp.]
MNRLILFICIVTICACQTSKIANNTIDRKYQKNAFQFHEVEIENYKLTFWDNGSEKPTLILLHGFGTWAKFNWHQQINELGSEYRVIIPNLLHFGKSSCTACEYTVDQQVEAMTILIDYLEIPYYYLGGASYGGVVAIELAEKQSDKVRKLLLIDSPVKFFTEKEIKDVQKQFNASSITDLLVPSNYKGLKDLSEILYKKPPFTPTSAYKSIYEDMFEPYTVEMRHTLNALLNSQNYFYNKDYQLQMPLLLVWGKDDMLVPKRVGFSLEKYFPHNSQLFVIDKTAHMPILEKPKICNEIILNFLDE